MDWLAMPEIISGDFLRLWAALVAPINPVLSAVQTGGSAQYDPRVGPAVRRNALSINQLCLCVLCPGR